MNSMLRHCRHKVSGCGKKQHGDRKIYLSSVWGNSWRLSAVKIWSRLIKATSGRRNLLRLYCIGVFQNLVIWMMMLMMMNAWTLKTRKLFCLCKYKVTLWRCWVTTESIDINRIVQCKLRINILWKKNYNI